MIIWSTSIHNKAHYISANLRSVVRKIRSVARKICRGNIKDPTINHIIIPRSYLVLLFNQSLLLHELFDGSISLIQLHLQFIDSALHENYVPELINDNIKRIITGDDINKSKIFKENGSRIHTIQIYMRKY